MPARFANLGMLLVLPVAVAALATSLAPRTSIALAGALVVAEGVLLVGARPVVFVQLLPAVLGLALGVLATRPPSAAWRAGMMLALLAVGGALAAVRAPDGSPLFWSFVLAAGVGVAVTLLWPAERKPGSALQAGVAVACVVTALVALRGPHPANVWDFGEERQSAEETSLAAWLHAHAPDRTMILSAPFPVLWLSPKTGHPPLVDMNTLLAMTYFPAHGDAVARLVRDVFEIDYADPAGLEAFRGPDGMLRPDSPAWLRTWSDRSCADWRELGTRYAFDLILVPHATRLRLEPVWSGPTRTLYRVPPACAPAESS